MSKAAMIRARTTKELKEEVETIFNELGLSTTEAINLFYKQVKLNKGLPFRISIPKEVTEKPIKDADENKNLVKGKEERLFFKY